MLTSSNRLQSRKQLNPLEICILKNKEGIRMNIWANRYRGSTRPSQVPTASNLSMPLGYTIDSPTKTQVSTLACMWSLELKGDCEKFRPCPYTANIWVSLHRTIQCIPILLSQPEGCCYWIQGPNDILTVGSSDYASEIGQHLVSTKTLPGTNSQMQEDHTTSLCVFEKTLASAPYTIYDWLVKNNVS